MSRFKYYIIMYSKGEPSKIYICRRNLQKVKKIIALCPKADLTIILCVVNILHLILSVSMIKNAFWPKWEI